MTLEAQTAAELTKQIVDDEKKIEELKKQLLAKKVTARALIKQAKKNEPELPSQFFNKTVAKLTGLFAKAHEDAEFALRDPDAYAASKLLAEADTLCNKANKIPDREHKKAQKYAVRCASMVMRLESAVDQLKLESTSKSQLDTLAGLLDGQVQRLRPAKKEEEKAEVIKQLEQTMQQIEEGVATC